MNTIYLPPFPENYYGSFPVVTNLKVGDVLYIGLSSACQEMTVQSLEQDLNNLVIKTDKAILMANSITRVNRKG